MIAASQARHRGSSHSHNNFASEPISFPEANVASSRVPSHFEFLGEDAAAKKKFPWSLSPLLVLLENQGRLQSSKSSPSRSLWPSALPPSNSLLSGLSTLSLTLCASPAAFDEAVPFFGL